MLISANISNDIYKAYSLLFYAFLLLLFDVFVFGISYIKKTKVIDCIYGILYMLACIILLFSSFIENEGKTLYYFLLVLILFIPYFASYLITLFLKKKNMEISVCALAFNLGVIFLALMVIMCEYTITVYAIEFM
jgi:hypothetical protein